MLVLAIAAVIIVMSVRYYQSASAAQRANACLSYLQAVAAAADSLSAATQSYSTLGTEEEVSKQINAIVPYNVAVCNVPGRADSTVVGFSDNIGIYIQLPEQACRLMIPALKASGHWGKNANPPEPIDEKDCPGYEGEQWIIYYRTKQF